MRPNAAVRWSVAGVTQRAEAVARAGDSGWLTLEYTAPRSSTDTVTAYVDVDEDGVRDAGEPLEIAMSEASLTGFQAWLESGPPGTDWNRR